MSSSRLKACDSCRHRHIRCEFDGPGACVCCQVYELECSFGKRKDEIYKGRRRRRRRPNQERARTGSVTTTMSMSETSGRTTTDGPLRDDNPTSPTLPTSPYHHQPMMLAASPENGVFLGSPESLHATGAGDVRPDDDDDESVAVSTFHHWRAHSIRSGASGGPYFGSEPLQVASAAAPADDSIADSYTTTDSTVLPGRRAVNIHNAPALLAEGPATVADFATEEASAHVYETAVRAEFDRFCKAMMIPFITDPAAFAGPRSTLLDICLKMADQDLSDRAKDKLVEALCVELNHGRIRDDTTCLALLLASMQTRAAPVASLVSQMCLTYVLTSASSSSSSSSASSSSASTPRDKLLAKVVVADAWNALAQSAKPSIPLSLHPPNPFSPKTEEYMHHLYRLSCLLDRIMLFNDTTTNEERFRVEYELWLFPVALSQQYMWLSPAFASVDANTLHICFWTLVLLYYIPHIGRPYMGLDPSMGLLLPLQHFGRNIMVVMFDYRAALWHWQPARAALRLCVENLCALATRYESDEAVSALKEFVRRARAPDVFPSLSRDKELLPLIAKAEQCDRPVVPREYDKATVVWMFRDLRVMSLSMLPHFDAHSDKR
ncbi:Zn(2)-C6 fungal-type DNA-binding domain protein [Niveomyces insectorum RCEF 264]|uniref:Zn(2)-C6 fungal-type DNA-binding domain protein n=1 Tax=Niveomyces insectorum RCEF 264 TaxID=1081102 RepID=A0A167UXH0_9HYPO|nr:Zn(2)-C6 fungal-type DNA-binding domain protein [Niveomyces insectorum RCEF 264]